MGASLRIFTHEFPPKKGGIATYCSEFAAAAQNAGYSVQVFGPSYIDSETINTADYPIHICRNRGTHNLTCILKTRNLLQNEFLNRSNDHFLLAEPGPILALGLLRRPAPANGITLTLHGSEIARWSKSPFANWIAKRAFSIASSIITVSHPVQNLLLKEFPSCANKAKVVHSAVPRFHRTTSQNPAKAQFTDTEKTLNILSVGRIHPRKNFEGLLKAIDLVGSAQESPIRLTIAGALKDEKYLNRLKTVAAQKATQVKWIIDPSDQELAHCYRQADAFALASSQTKQSIEGYGIVFLEAGCYGLPCIAYKEGGIEDAIQDGVTGWVVPSNDSAAFAERLAALMDSQQLREKMGNAGRDRAMSRDWMQVVQESIQMD